MRAQLAVLTGILLATLGAAPSAAVASGSAVTPAASTTCTVNPATPKRQFRAMWIATVEDLDWPNSTDEATAKAQFIHELDYAVSKNMNAVIVQIRPTADAFWPSPYEPWSGYLTGVRGQDPGWDPLAFMVAAAHARNLEFHAWFNPFRASMPATSASSPEAGGDINKLAPTSPLRAHPDWAVVYPAGTAASQLYYNPGIPAVREYVENAIMDAVSRYDIDGVQFDDYYYPYPAAGQDFGDDATFAQYGAGFTNKNDWRRNNIDLFIQEISAKIHAAKPWVRFGVSPFGIWRNSSEDPLGSATSGSESYDITYSDTRLWV
ncbi:MAG TPA: family 10 glycosylhydrolase, partial [Micromonosporaceae bacterium]